MSLINDALKRARESQSDLPPQSPPPLFPAANSSRGGIGWILPTAIVLLFAAVVIIVWLVFFQQKSFVKNLPPTPVAVAAAPAEIHALKKSESAPTAISKIKSNSSNATVAETNAPTAPLFEILPHIQAVIFSAPPAAIVDGKIVAVGGHVGDFLVKKIEQNSVTFQRPDGSTKQLHVGE